MICRTSAGFLLVVYAALAQTPTGPLTFEVASIRTAEPLMGKMMAGPIRFGMQVEGDRVTISFMSLADLVRTAYGVKAYQVQGPDWMSQQRYDIAAKMPEGATKEQAPEMLQALLAERFKLTLHRDTKDHPVYALVVGKNGTKLKEVEPDPPAPTGAPSTGGTGGPRSIAVSGGGNSIRYSTTSEGSTAALGAMHLDRKMTMAQLATFVAGFADKPVLDMTELKGTYQVAMDLPMSDLIKMKGASVVTIGGPMNAGASDTASDPSGSAIFGIIQQLGLKLEPRKLPLEMLVIDHLEKTPTEN